MLSVWDIPKIDAVMELGNPDDSDRVAWCRIKKELEELAQQTHNSAMDAISASEEYESSEMSRGVKCISRAFLAGVEWQKHHQ